MIIETTDGVYTYTNADYNNKYTDTKFKLQNNLKVSNTQGYQVKKQVGQTRLSASIMLADTYANLVSTLLPMLNYPVPVQVTFERNPLLKVALY